MKQKQNALFALATTRGKCCTKSMQINSQQKGGRGLGTQGGMGKGEGGAWEQFLMCLQLLRNWQSIRATNNVGNYALSGD